MTEEQPRSTIAGTFDISLTLTDKRQIRMTGYVYSDDNPQQVNARVDQFQDVLDRQSIRCDLVNKEAQIAGTKQNLKNLRDAYNDLVGKKRKGPLTSQEQNHVDGYDQSVRKGKELIDSLGAAIAEGKKKLANGSAVGA